MSTFDSLYSQSCKGMKRSEIRELLKFTRKPGMISFAGGLPAPDLFPVAEIEEMTRIALERDGRNALQYGPTEGDSRLREILLKRMEDDGIHLELENLIIITSSQQGLDLTAKILIDPGDIVIMSKPTYVGAIQSFNAYGANMIGVELDGEGTDTEKLEETVKRLRSEGKVPKFIYEVPDFQNPSGITMTLERRRELLRIAEENNLLVIEDSPYRQLRFEGEPEPPLISMNSERVLALYTFSKILLPGFRLGWMAGPKELIEKAVTAKQGVDLCSPSFNQSIFYEFIRHGHLDSQITKIIAAYREKRDFMIGCLEKYMPKLEGLSWTHPRGGLFLWVTLPNSYNTTKMFQAAVEKDVAYVIGSAFHPQGDGQNTMRLNFSFSSMEEIDEGVKRLAEVIRDWKE